MGIAVASFSSATTSHPRSPDRCRVIDPGPAPSSKMRVPRPASCRTREAAESPCGLISYSYLCRGCGVKAFPGSFLDMKRRIPIGSNGSQPESRLNHDKSCYFCYLTERQLQSPATDRTCTPRCHYFALISHQTGGRASAIMHARYRGTRYEWSEYFLGSGRL
jgi:hypothetical protein